MRVSATRGATCCTERIRLPHEFLGQEIELAADAPRRLPAARRAASICADSRSSSSRTSDFVRQQRDFLRQALLRHAGACRPRRAARRAGPSALALRFRLVGGLGRRGVAQRGDLVEQPGQDVGELRRPRPPRAATRPARAAVEGARRASARFASSAASSRLGGLGAHHAGQGQQRLGARRRARRGCGRPGRARGAAPGPAPPGRAAAAAAPPASGSGSRRRCRA